jgi:GPH family glycoside/pentoside/hexuronide:cation symporter
MTHTSDHLMAGEMNRNQQERSADSSGDRVAFREKVALGVGQFSSMFANSCMNTVGRTVYIMILGINAAWIGVALTIPRVVDAFLDPLMGKISDNFRSRWGRRRPFIVFGASCMGIVFGLTWMVPQHWSDGAKIVFFTAMQLLFYVFYTMFVVPFNALMYEMTPDYTERNRVMAYVAFFHKAAEFLYEWIIPLAAVFSSLYFLERIPAGQQVEMNGIRIVTWLVGLLLMTGVGVIPGLFVRERFAKKTEHQEEVKLLQTCKEAFVNRPFMILVAITVLNFLAGVLASNIDAFVMVYYMANGDIALGSIWKGLLSSGYAVVGFAFIPIITWLANKSGKSGCLYVVYGLTVIGGVMKWFIFTPGHHLYYVGRIAIDPIILIDPLLCGPMWVAVRILLYSMIADVCDEDELAYGKRREGMYGAVFSWVEKTIYSLSGLAVGLTITLSGYNAAFGGNQTPTTFTVMRLFLAGAPAITALLAIVALRFYPITAERAGETRRRLEERRGAITVA